MFSFPRSVSILLATPPVDLLKSIDGLRAMVRSEWKEDVFSGHLFAFVNRRGNRVKLLTWDSGGFVLYYKRLEQGRYAAFGLHWGGKHRSQRSGFDRSASSSLPSW